jgi:CheY-like chemotaxis protein
MAPKAAKISVLVVDDDPMIRELLELLLSGAGYRVVTAQGGGEAVVAAVESNPDMMILDINMPEIDGFAVLAALTDFALPRPPLTIVLTARYAVQDVDRALALGASDYLTKPFSNKQFLDRVGRLSKQLEELPKEPD